MTTGRGLERQNWFCISCHEMRGYDKQSKESGASDSHPTCIGCHSGPGLPGIADSQIRGLKYFYLHSTGTEKQLTPPFKAKMPDHFCTQCHARATIAPVHARLPAQGRACAECHRHQPGWSFEGEVRG